MSAFALQGTQNQQRIVAEAIAASTFPWDRLKPAVLAQRGDRDYIPVEWQDLSRYALTPAAPAEHNHDDHAHATSLHWHVKDRGDVAHVLAVPGPAARARVLGLAWYSLKITLDESLEANEALAREVFLSEVAHMVDFTVMTALQREAIFRAYHDVTGPVPDHGHGWFEETGNQDYWQWVGESFMAGFLLAFTKITPTIGGFSHASTPTIGTAIRRILNAQPVWGLEGSAVFHDIHANAKGTGYRTVLEWADREAAIAEGRRPCGVCRP